MPIKQKDLGKYRRSGIFIEEFDESLVELPIQETLINLVPGFSRKGPFNNPTYVQTPSEFKAIFGDIDKKLENRGSFFHRTVLKMLETGPVWALNLLNVDDNDIVDWKSVSVSSGVDNKRNETIPYNKLFNRQDFWERSDESFYDYLLKNKSEGDANFINRLVQLTNVGDKVSTVFMFKSQTPGFNITAEEWYGGLTKVPLFIRPEDMISDYMVSVIIVSGDWTDYNSLSVDSTWSKFFNVNGLDKTKVSEFLNQSTVTVTGQYDCSLIPGFKDLNDRGMFIKDVVNTYTNITGIFCTFDEDLLNSADFPEGKIDIIGESLTYSSVDKIDFMSYNTQITEDVLFKGESLNSINNVFGNYDKDLNTSFATISGTPVRKCDANRTHTYVDNVMVSANPEFKIYEVSEFKWLNGGINGTSPVPSYITSGTPISFTQSFDKISKGVIYYAKKGTSPNTSIEIYSDKSLTEKIVLSEPSDVTKAYVPSNTFLVIKDTSFSKINTSNDSYFIYDNIHTIDPVVSFKNFEAGNYDLNQTFYKVDIYYVEAGKSGIFVSEGDIISSNSITVDSGGRIDIDKSNIILHSVNKSNVVVLGYTVNYHRVSGPNNVYKADYFGVTVDRRGYLPNDSIYMVTNNEKSVSINFNKVVGISSKYHNENLDKIKSKMLTALNKGKHAGFINKDGNKVYIETYKVSSDTNDIVFTLNDSDKIEESGTFLMFYSDVEFVAPATQLNGFKENIAPTTTNQGIIGKDCYLYKQYYDGYINSGDYFKMVDGLEKYLLFYMNDESQLIVSIVEKSGTTPVTINTTDITFDGNIMLDVVSKLGNMKQTIELERPKSYVDLKNIKIFYVDANRYGELRKGSYIESFIPEIDPYDEESSYIKSTGKYTNGHSPRKLSRIVKVKRIDDAGKLLLEITTDTAISVENKGTVESPEFQAYSFTELEQYVKEYSGMKLIPFKLRNESIPDGTDLRQSHIMNVLGKGTNLSKGLANKNRITWRYLIDSFGLGLEVPAYPGGSKQQFVDLCGLKKNCLGFISMPSARDFKRSVNPSFTDDDGALSTKYMSEGANIDLNPNYLYEFGDGEGNSAVGYFFPYAKTVDVDGVGKFVPPAMFAADTYMQKFLGIRSDLKAFTIMAGVTNGQVTGIGETEMNFNNDDLVNLQQMGANPIVYKMNHGYVLDSENTAKVFPRTSLSLIHAREVLIELENRLYDMLLTYQWKFNNAETRAQIKYAADKICKELQDDGALYNFTNVIDKTNNPDYIINLEMGVLDTYIEIVKGMGIIVNNITVLKKGDIESSGFGA